MKVKTIAITEITLGVLTIAAHICPAPCSDILFGATLRS